MQLPFIGLYTTTYNTEHTIKDFINSLYKTFGENFILTVVDNYSSDNTYTLLREYENVYIIQKRCKRGLGYQLALSILLKKFEPEFIIRTEADLIFYPDIERKFVKHSIKYYEEGELWGGGFASYDTYLKILKNNYFYPNANVFEDFIWWAKLIKHGIKLVWPMLIPSGYTPSIPYREKRYAVGIEYIKRKIGFFVDTFHYLYFNMFNFKTLSFHKVRRDFIRLIFPDEIDLRNDYLLYYSPIRYFPFDLFKNRKNIQLQKVKKYVVAFAKTKDKLIIQLQKNFIEWLKGSR